MEASVILLPSHQVGDILRLGSVGLLVSEMNLGDNNGNEMVRDDILQQIRDEVEPVPRQILAPLREDFKGLKDEYMAEPVENVSENGQSRYKGRLNGSREMMAILYPLNGMLSA